MNESNGASEKDGLADGANLIIKLKIISYEAFEGGCIEIALAREPSLQYFYSEELLEGLINWYYFDYVLASYVLNGAVTKCTSCGSDFNAFNRKCHYQNCGDIFRDKCTQGGGGISIIYGGITFRAKVEASLADGVSWRMLEGDIEENEYMMPPYGASYVAYGKNSKKRASMKSPSNVETRLLLSSILLNSKSSLFLSLCKYQSFFRMPNGQVSSRFQAEPPNVQQKKTLQFSVEQEEALLALVDHRTKEVVHLRQRASYYTSQMEFNTMAT
ncbi:unnamed protein product [Fraxinus pennsylvanica]|uniref:FYVE zinc finger domain-containing protein n=1 Tax=Fraxinus pennsylvanica TaxID=56036 RepID=A0AAD1ZKR1_9LAMI|nr:unnamed protein product [Fraxinus pennsylvanica]